MRCAIAGLIIGLLLGLSPLAEASALSAKALWTLGAGLGFTYLSIGVLVGVLPLFGPFRGADSNRFAGALFGLLVGAAYSVPGAFFTMAPYPLAEDAASYWREFSDGGLRAFAFTLIFGGGVGAICGLFRKPIRRGTAARPG